MSTQAEQLLEVCKAFISKHQIHSADTIYQSDRIIEDATRFIEQVCDVVGYVDLEDEDDADLFQTKGGGE